MVPSVSQEKTTLDEPPRSVSRPAGRDSPIIGPFGHRSDLPLILYPLSFAPPLKRPWVSLREFLGHPWVLYAIGLIAVMISSAILPVVQLVQGKVWLPGVNDFTKSVDERTQVGVDTAMYSLAISLVMLFSYFTWFYCFAKASHILVESIRLEYVSSVISQDAAYFDKYGSGEIATKATTDLDTIDKGFGENLGWFLWLVCYLIAAVIVAVETVPKIGGSLLSFVAFVIGSFFIIGIAIRKYETRADMSKDSSSTFLEQCLSGIRVVQTFSMSQPLMKRWVSLLGDTERTGNQQARIRGLEGAVTMLSALSALGVGLYYGSKLVPDGLNYGFVITAVYNITNIHYMCFFRLSALASVRKSVVSLRNVRHHIERQPHIDIRDPNGITVEEAASQPDWSASIALEQVTFAYPSRPNVKVLDGVTFSAEAGKLTAICGGSGAGKSCVASLLIRQYDPASANVANAHDHKDDKQRDDLRVRLTNGRNVDSAEKGLTDTQGEAPANDDHVAAVQGNGIIRLGGLDIRSYNLRSLRSSISVVQQEPQLISGTVFENIAAGLTGTPFEFRMDLDGENDKKVQATRERCIEALKKAEAWDFVEGLPEGIDTKISGGRNGILSGGQQQRLAIARALISQPRLLLLDEATSALSSDVELSIRNNLEAEQEKTGMTVVSIAHRLQFAQRAHKIIVMDRGRVVDEGAFDELVQPGRSSRIFADMATTGSMQHLIIPKSEDRRIEVEMTELPIKSGSSSTTDIVSSNKSEMRDQPSDDPNPSKDLAAYTVRPRYLPDLLRRLGSRRLFLCLALILGFINGGSYIATSYTLGRTVAVLSGAPDGKTIGGFYIWIWLGFAVFLSLTVYCQDIFGTSAQKRLEKVIASTAVTALMKQDVSFFEEEAGSAGSLTAGIAKHSGNYAQALSDSAITITMLLTTIIGSWILCFLLDWEFALVIIPFGALSIFAGSAQVRSDTEVEKTHNQHQEAVSDQVNEVMDQIPTIVVLGQEGEVVRRLALSKKTEGADRWLVAKQAAHALGESSSAATAAMVYWRGAYLFARGKISATVLFAVFIATFDIVLSFSPLLMQINTVSQGRASWSVLRKYMERQPRYPVKPLSTEERDRADDAMRDDIVFHNVEMVYPKRKEFSALRSFNFRLRGGKVNALTGPSGGGKSTILALLQRFYEPTAGRITFGNIDSQALPLDTLRSHLAIVSQNSVLFEGDIRFNLSLGARDPDNVLQAELDYVCKEACIYDFIMSLPEGFSTDIGLKGTRLSGGQRQRLCIARALLRNPSILLLDEATSSLDAVNEAEVEKALQNASKGRTVVVVAHKLQSIRNADYISVIEGGQLVETGSHDALVEKSSRYFDLIRYQL